MKHQIQQEQAKRSYYSLDRYVDTDPIRWIQKHFYIPETNAAMQLHESQYIPLKEALEKDGELFRYSTVCWSAIKKSAKSSIAAAVGLWFAFQREWSSVKVIANDLRQADSRVAYYMRRAIILHPEWRHLVKITNYKIQLPNHSIIEAIPIDPKGESGGSDDLLIFSEIWGWKNTATLTMWTEATLSPLKFGKSMRWCETYSGFIGASPILEQLYEQGVKEGRCINERYEMYVNESARLFTLWNTRPHLDWQNQSYYAQEAAMLTPNEFNRVHRNQFVSSQDAFIPIEWWDSCLGDIPALREYQQVVIGLDAAVVGDCFAIVAVSRDANGTCYVRRVRIWTPPTNGKIQFRNPHNPYDPTTPEGVLRAWCKEWRVAEVAYDPTQMEDLATSLYAEGIAYFRAFMQGTERLIADKTLYDVIRDGRIRHDGDTTLRIHIANANQQVDKESSKLRIVKRTEAAKIDACVALSMAVARALYLNIT